MTSPNPSPSLNEPRTPRQLYHAAPPPASAVAITVGAVLALYGLQLGLAAAGVPVLVATSVAYIVAIAGIVVIARVSPAALGVRPVAVRFLVAAVLVGISAWYIDLRLVLWIGPPGGSEILEKLVVRPGLVTTLLALALLPAIAEELVFRGLLARALAQRSTILAIVGSAIVFSAYHMRPVQMVSTFPLGLALAYLAIRADSIVPSTIAHLLNNATVIVLQRDELPSLGRTLGAHPTALLAGTLVLAAAGLALAGRAT